MSLDATNKNYRGKDIWENGECVGTVVKSVPIWERVKMIVEPQPPFKEPHEAYKEQEH